jgi:hypothetical protein
MTHSASEEANAQFIQSSKQQQVPGTGRTPLGSVSLRAEEESTQLRA